MHQEDLVSNALKRMSGGMENGCNPNPNPSGDLEEAAKDKRGGAYFTIL